MSTEQEIPTQQPELTKEEKRKKQLREAAKRYYQTHKAVKANNAEYVPKSYNINYQREYHRSYYQANRDKLLTRSKEKYVKKNTPPPSDGEATSE